MNLIRLMVTAMAVMPALAWACVDARTGTLCESFADITRTTHAHELKLLRRYDSGAAAHDGWFGHGWSTAFELKLTVLPDGSMRADDPGNGVQDRYAAPRAAGQPARSAKCSATAARTAAGFQRTDCSGHRDEFDAAGRLLSHCEGRYCTRIGYADGKPERITDSYGQQLLLVWSADGHVAEVRDESGKLLADYRYENGNLVQATVPPAADASADAPQREYQYAYDGSHRLTRIDADKQLSLAVSYDEAGRVIRAGDEEQSNQFEYTPDPGQPESHLRVVRTEVGVGAGYTRRYEAEYFLEPDSAGIPRLRRVVKSSRRGDVDVREEIILDAQERILSMHKSAGEFFEVVYDAPSGRPASVVTHEGRRDFGYDARGNLISVRDSNGDRIRLIYDSDKQITRMVMRRRGEKTRDLSYRYNADGKPVLIRMAGRGEIRVEYDSKGEITKVDSPQGARMALEVTQAFQSLLAMVKTPNANLCP